MSVSVAYRDGMNDSRQGVIRWAVTDWATGTYRDHHSLQEAVIDASSRARDFAQRGEPWEFAMVTREHRLPTSGNPDDGYSSVRIPEMGLVDEREPQDLWFAVRGRAGHRVAAAETLDQAKAFMADPANAELGCHSVELVIAEHVGRVGADGSAQWALSGAELELAQGACHAIGVNAAS